MAPSDWDDPGGLGAREAAGRGDGAAGRDDRDVAAERAAVNVSVIGASSCGPQLVALGEELGKLLAQCDCTVFCGGMSGVMEAVARGVRRGGGVCVGILPTLDRRHAALDLTLSVCTGMGHARNLAVVASGDVVIALGGSWGTLSELGMARAIGRQVVLLESWSVRPTPSEAVNTTASQAASVDFTPEGRHQDADGGELDGLHRAAGPAEAVELALSLIGR